MKTRTTTMKRTLLTLALLALPLAMNVASEQSAEAANGVLTVSTRMPAKSLVDLRHDVAQARAIDSRPFVNVQSIVTNAPAADARARGRKAGTALYLAKLGPSALMPMLEMLALDAPKGIPAEAAPGVRRDLIEAVGLLRDAKALPVLTAILDDKSEDEETTTRAAEALGRIGTDEAAARILTALEASKAEVGRTRAIITGAGDCRRLKVTEALATHLRTTTDEATARAAAKSLGRTGNAWVWQSLADRSEESRVREAAARALVDAYVRRDGEARDAAAKAILVVDDAHTPALITEAKATASADAKKALDELATRFANNPSRTH
jgi:hypothetical protein